MYSAAVQKFRLNLELSRLIRYCQKLQRGKMLPDWQDFAPTDLPLLAGHLFAADVVGEATDFIYRTYGTLMPEYFGFDMRGKRLSEAPDAAFRTAVRQTYEDVIAEKRPIAHWVELSWPDGGRYALQYVLIPFGNISGGKMAGQVMTILGGVQASVSREELSRLRGCSMANFREMQCETL